MIRILREKNSGKSIQLLSSAHQHKAVVVSGSPEALQKLANERGYSDVKIISYAEAQNGKTTNFGTDILIDDINKFAHSVIDGHLIGYTLSLDVDV